MSGYPKRTIGKQYDGLVTYMSVFAGHVYRKGGEDIEVDGERGVVFDQENVRRRRVPETVR